MKKAIIILGLLVLTNCAYKPKINPEASLHPHTGENLAGKYYYYNDRQLINIWARRCDKKL